MRTTTLLQWISPVMAGLVGAITARSANHSSYLQDERGRGTLFARSTTISALWTLTADGQLRPTCSLSRGEVSHPSRIIGLQYGYQI